LYHSGAQSEQVLSYSSPLSILIGLTSALRISFGHFHRWLKLDAYRSLAECPEGIEHPFSLTKEPFSLCPTDPRAVELLRDLYAQLLPNFSAKEVNIGFDETWDVGRGRSKDIVAAEGLLNTYLKFLHTIRSLIPQHRVQFWADILLHSYHQKQSQPQSQQQQQTQSSQKEISTRDSVGSEQQSLEWTQRLPPNCVALVWGYEANHPFREQTAVLASAKCPFYVCPGTSSWNSFAGRTQNMIENIRCAATSGYENGALGLLLTDWGDYGHLQPFSVSYLGILVGATFAWNVHHSAKAIVSTLTLAPAPLAASSSSSSSSSSPLSSQQATPATSRALLCEMLNRHIFKDNANVMGAVVYDLGDTYQLTGVILENRSQLFEALLFPERIHRYPWTESALEQTLSHIITAIAPLHTAQMQRSDAQLIKTEFLWVSELLQLACKFGLAFLAEKQKPFNAQNADYSFVNLSQSVKDSLATELLGIITVFSNLWPQRNRFGGFLDSKHYLERVLHLLQNESKEKQTP
jgi:hexosaminidase